MTINEGVSGTGCKTQSLAAVVETSKAQCTMLRGDGLTASIYVHLRVWETLLFPLSWEVSSALSRRGLCSLPHHPEV